MKPPAFVRRLAERCRKRRRPVIPALRLGGIIGGAGSLRGAGLTMAGLERAITAAFEVKRAPAVALIINSPGGSPVQSALIARHIRRLADAKNKPVLAFIEDIGASGGYWLACAGDEVFCDRSSIVGSIGVISAGFGFQDAIARLGVERRVHATGARKSLLDPFRAEDPDDVATLREVQDDVYASFVDLVRERRGERLQGSDEDLFDGRVWSGEAALRLGLVDALGDVHGVVRERYGERAQLRVMNAPRNWLQRRLRPGLGAELVDAALTRIEERLMLGRFGL